MFFKICKWGFFYQHWTFLFGMVGQTSGHPSPGAAVYMGFPPPLSLPHIGWDFQYRARQFDVLGAIWLPSVLTINVKYAAKELRLLADNVILGIGDGLWSFRGCLWPVLVQIMTPCNGHCQGASITANLPSSTYSTILHPYYVLLSGAGTGVDGRFLSHSLYCIVVDILLSPFSRSLTLTT